MFLRPIFLFISWRLRFEKYWNFRHALLLSVSHPFLANMYLSSLSTHHIYKPSLWLNTVSLIWNTFNRTQLVSLLTSYQYWWQQIGYIKSSERLTVKKCLLYKGDIKVPFLWPKLHCKALSAYSRLLKRKARSSAHRYPQNGHNCCCPCSCCHCRT